MSTDDHRPEPDFTPASYKLRVDGTVYNITNPEPTASEILRLIGKDPATHVLIFLVPGEEKRTLAPDDNIDLRQPGIEEFTFASTLGKFVIYIDETRVELLNPEPTGLELLQAVGKQLTDYALTQILPGVDDQFISPEEKVDLRYAGVERFTTVAKEDITIIVNGQQKVVTVPVLSYDDLANLAFDNNPPKGPGVVITINYRKGHGDKPEGSVSQGGTVKVKNGMIFNVTATNQS